MTLGVVALGVVAFGVVAFGVKASPEPAALLFRLSFFSFLSFTPAEIGLFSAPFVDFLLGAGRSSVFNGDGVGASLVDIGSGPDA